MKFSLAFAALVATASAHAIQKREGGEYPDSSEQPVGGAYTTTTLIKTTYVTTCPVTTTKTEEGITKTDTYTTVSTVTTEVPTTVVITPTETKTFQEVIPLGYLRQHHISTCSR